MRKKTVFLGVTFVLLFFLATPALAYPDADLNCDNDVDVLDIQLSIYLALDLALSTILDADQNGVVDDCGDPPMEVVCGAGTELSPDGGECVVSQATLDAAYIDGAASLGYGCFQIEEWLGPDAWLMGYDDIIVSCLSLGPGEDLSGGKDISGTDLSGIHLTGADLTDLHATNLVGCPASLPSEWECIGGGCASNGECVSYNLVGPTANLSDSNLVNADLTDMNLTSVNLMFANLLGVTLTGANLTGANLTGANLSNVDLSDVDLSYVHGVELAACPAALPYPWHCIQNNLVGPTANLSFIDFNGANLEWKTIDGADLSSTDFTGAQLKGIHAHNVKCNSWTTLPSNWVCVDDPNGADSFGDYLVGPQANLNGADLSGAVLSGLNLWSVYLQNSNLSGANLENTNLHDANLTNINWSNTICPDGTVAPGIKDPSCCDHLIGVPASGCP